MVCVGHVSGIPEVSMCRISQFVLDVPPFRLKLEMACTSDQGKVINVYQEAVGEQKEADKAYSPGAQKVQPFREASTRHH